MKITPSAILVHNELVDNMVMCVVIGCSKRSGRDKDVSFYRIPKVISHRGKQEYEMTKRRRAGYLAAISREGLRGTRILENDRICSRHFISGKPAYLYDDANPDWLPSLHLGHAKRKPELQTKATERWDRRKARSERAKEIEAAQSLLLLKDAEETTELEETERSVATQTELTSANVHAMQQLLSHQQQVIEDLTARLTRRLAPFSEKSLQNDEMVN